MGKAHALWDAQMGRVPSAARHASHAPVHINILSFTHALTNNTSSACIVLHKDAPNLRQQSPSQEADTSPAGEEILLSL
jgi:hypothetical protein